jgi:hypothetical protein
MALGGAMSVGTTGTVALTSSEFLGNKAVVVTNTLQLGG